MVRIHDFGRGAVFAAAAAIAAAWLGLGLWSASPYASLLDHQAIGESDFSPVVRVAGFALGWTLMVVAMMLPGSLPLVARLDRELRRQPQRVRRLAAFAASYLLAWLAFGLALYAGDYLLHEAVEQLPALEARPGLIAGCVLLGAGLYLLVPAVHAARGSAAPAIEPAARLGFAHACSGMLGCGVWMVLMFAFAGGNPAWMLLLGAAGAVEQHAPWGGRLARLAGAALTAWAVLGLAGVLPLPGPR